MTLITSLLAGLIFGIGLIAGGMTDPAKVKGFLDLFGTWDPSLALVMGGAIAVGSVGFAIARKRGATWAGGKIDWPTLTTIDSRLVIGGVLFGAGWGIGGFCPGPAIVSFASGFGPALWFIPAMLVGMWAHDRVMVGK
jgi:uncharacterized membrane protein YedE/YeeE